MRFFKIVLGLVFLCIGNNSFGQVYKTEAEWKDFFNENKSILEPLEGLYNCTRTITKKEEGAKPLTLKPFTCAILYEGDAFLTKRTDDSDPDIKVYFGKADNHYIMIRYDSNSGDKIQADVTVSKNSIKFSYENLDGQSTVTEEWVKIYP